MGFFFFLILLAVMRLDFCTYELTSILQTNCHQHKVLQKCLSVHLFVLKLNTLNCGYLASYFCSLSAGYNVHFQSQKRKRKVNHIYISNL